MDALLLKLIVLFGGTAASNGHIFADGLHAQSMLWILRWGIWAWSIRRPEKSSPLCDLYPRR
jgi:hypothetical protein